MQAEVSCSNAPVLDPLWAQAGPLGGASRGRLDALWALAGCRPPLPLLCLPALQLNPNPKTTPFPACAG